MALTKKITVTAFGSDIQIPNAYIKVRSIEGNKGDIRAVVDVKTAVDGEILSTFDCHFVPDLEQGNFIAQAYTAIKSLDEYKDAIDC